MKCYNGLKLSIFILLLSLSSFAHSKQLSAYTTELNPVAKAAKKLNLHPPTAITIINASINNIYAQVPYTDIDRMIAPAGLNLHIYNYDPNIRSTQIILMDPYRAAFYNRFVCPLAIVTIYGYPGNYKINYDEHLCRS